MLKTFGDLDPNGTYTVLLPTGDTAFGCGDNDLVLAEITRRGLTEFWEAADGARHMLVGNGANKHEIFTYFAKPGDSGYLWVIFEGPNAARLRDDYLSAMKAQPLDAQPH